MAWGSPGGREELGIFRTWKRASMAKGQSDGSSQGAQLLRGQVVLGVESGVGQEPVTGKVFGPLPTSSTVD